MYDFQWIGESTPSNRGKIFSSYESFSSGEVIYKVDDYVLIRNDDSVDPEDIFNCFIAQIKELYVTGSVHKPNRAHVKWFSRTSDLPIHCQKFLDHIDDFEVVEDNRKGWSCVIDAETIFDKCEINFLKLSEEPPSNINQNGEPAFFCRYRFVGNKLKPLEESVSVCTTPNNKDVKPNRKKDLYYAMTTGSLEYPKVLIRRIDDKILACKDENIRILVAKPDAKSIEDVTANLDELTLLSPSRSTSRKRPYIHSLTMTSQNNGSDLSDMDGLMSDTESQCDMNLNRRVKTSSSNELIENKTPIRTSSRIKNYTPKKVEKVKNCSPKTVDNVKNCTSRRVENIKNCPTKTLENVKNCTPKRVENIKNYTPKKNKSPKKSIAIGPSPSKKTKTPRRLEFSVAEEYTVTRSGRKVKSMPRCVINDSDEESKNVMVDAKKKLSKFIRTTYSDDSESLYSMSSEESSSENEGIESEYAEENPSLLKMKAKRSRSKSNKNTPLRKKSLSMPDRKTPLKGPQNILEESRLRLHVSSVPKSLPCREDEYSDIYSFVKGCLCSHTGGCMYISGVPGTGKTATVHEVIRNLENEKEKGQVPIFYFVEVNGMWVTEPYQCYVNIFKALTGKTIASQQAANLLEKRFTEQGPKKDAVILLVDELDRLWTRKQTVLYNIFDWPTKKHSKLIVLAIANTINLPELLKNRISSRLGLTRKVFQPYNFKQLQEIIMSRIQELKVFDSDAVQLVSRKVAAVSGDARRALDICRHATEVAERNKSSPKKKCKILVGMDHVDVAIQQMLSSPVISAIRCASKLEKLFLQCVLADFNRTGSEETTLLKVSEHLDSSCRFEGIMTPSTSEVTQVCARLVHSSLILVDNFRNGLHMKIRLNASPEDVNTALTGRM